MRVQIGPLPSGSVTMWTAYARTVLAQALARPGSHGVVLDDSVVESFESFLAEWEDEARRSPEFLWVAEVEADRVEHLVHAWSKLAAGLAVEAEQRGFPLAPPETDAFYQALVAAALDALAHEGRTRTAFAEDLRDDWPGLKTED